MSRLLKTIIIVFVLVAWGTLPSCLSEVSSETHLQQEASHLQERTTPPDSRLVSQDPPTIQAGVACASWEFQTNYSADAYKRWLINRLQPDFQVHEAPNSGLRFNKYAQGDVEMLTVKTASSSGILQVAVKLEVYPD